MNESSDLETLYNHGLDFYRQGRPDTAAEYFGRAVALAPDCSPALNGLGLALSALGRRTEALRHYESAIRFDPTFASPYINRGVAQREMGQLDLALASLDRAIVLQPDNPNAHGNRGSVLTELKQPVAAIASFDRALQLNPAYPALRGIRLVNKMYICDWTNIDREIDDLLARIDRGEPATPPWPLLPMTDRAPEQRKVAESWAAEKFRENPALGPVAKYTDRGRIRIGYYSADFYRHATAYLIAELFERHDRTKFEVMAFSFGPATGDDMHKRLIAGCDQFIDVRARSDREVAALSRDLKIDIAVDLKGFTEGQRLGIFAYRAAPIQVNYLGYPMTLGAPYIDYIIADKTVIPDADRAFYTEKVVTLPDCYQVNDTHRKIGERKFTRAELGLPETGFVFCCFNNNFKIMPQIFDIWMRILKAVDGSVLWLIEDSPLSGANLRRHAEARGVDPGRLVFAARIPPEDHLSRQGEADLFLDTLPYNAHTTASDALWVGLPLLTCPGGSFAARVAASLLRAMDMPELIAPTLKDYEALAVALATDPERLAAIRRKLEHNRWTAPLFNTELFTRNIEAAYQRMFDDYRSSVTSVV